MGVSEKTVRPAAAEGATKETATGGAATKEAAAEVATKETAAGAATNMRPATGTAPMPGKAATGAAAPVRPQEDPLETNPLETNPLETNPLETNPLELIPQRPPMVLVDRFEGIDAEGVSTTGYTVEPAGLFVAGGRMSECGIIEHMAQSAAARIGWCCRAEGRPVPVGFIGAVSRLELHDLPRTGVHLRTRLRIVQEIGPLSLAEVRTEADGRPLAEGNLKIYLQS